MMKPLPLLTLVALCLSVAPAGMADDEFPPRECKPDFQVELENRTESDEVVRLDFRVDLTTAESCAEVGYDLIVEELLPNGQWKSYRLRRHVAARDGVASQVVEHTMSTDLKLLGHRVLLVECRLCEARTVADARTHPPVP
jgi:hypothetical protein